MAEFREDGTVEFWNRTFYSIVESNEAYADDPTPFGDAYDRIEAVYDFNSDISGDEYDTWEEYCEAVPSAILKAKLAIKAIEHMMEHGGSIPLL